MRRSDECIPSNFCLSENFVAVTESLNRIRHTLDKSYKKRIKQYKSPSIHDTVWFDFASIRRITPSSALALTSEFDRAMRLVGGRRLSLVNVEKWNFEVLRNLAELGLLEMFGISPDNKELHKLGKTILLPIRSSDLVLGGEANELYEGIRALIDNIELADIDDAANKRLRAEICAILTEAMENVATHAYPEGADFDFHFLPRWWMTAALNTDEKKLTVAMYDQGVSIPVSLPSWERYDKVDAMLRRFKNMLANRNEIGDVTDGLAIRVAMKVAVSATREENRGKGLPEMKRFIDSCRDGHLRIISRAGEYVYRKNERPRAFNHPTSLGGTLIEWEVLL